MRRSKMFRATRTLASMLLLAAPLALVAPASAQGQESAGGFLDRFGFEAMGDARTASGRTGTIYYATGVWADDAELRVVADPGDVVVSAELFVSRRRMTADPRAAHQLVAAFLEMITPVEDQARIGPLRGMILSDDIAKRRGEDERSPVAERRDEVDRSHGCCALPPVPARDVAAVGVVDGRRSYALVRLEFASVRFYQVEDGPGGEPALRITVLGPDSPERVVEAVFDAARYGDASWLVDLCVFGEEADGDVRALCDLKPDHPRWSSFVETFRTGEVTGPVEVDGDRARVPFRFGPDGGRTEVMELIRVSGRWSLASF